MINEIQNKIFKEFYDLIFFQSHMNNREKVWDEIVRNVNLVKAKNQVYFQLWLEKIKK